MRKGLLIIFFTLILSSVFSQKTKPSLQLKAFQRGYISGVAPTTNIAFGGKESNDTTLSQEPEYFIYLIAYKIPNLKIERVWIRQQLYLVSMDKIQNKSVLLKDNNIKDSLLKSIDQAIWQIKIIRKDSSGNPPKKDIINQVKENELVLRLTDKNGHSITRNIKKIKVLEADRGQ